MNSLRRLLILTGLWLLCAMAHAGTAHYYYTDPQGTVLAKADAQGNIIASYDYKPYGAQALGAPPNGPGYTGHVNDPDTGLVYMQQRYYDPSVGRFLSVDPVRPAAGNPFNFSRYAYANDNPARFTDPDGRQSVGEMIDAGAQGCGAVSCAGWAVLHAAWSMTGAEPVSQVADKGWSNVSTGDKIGAAVAVAAVVVPVGRIVGKVAEGAVVTKAAGSAGKTVLGHFPEYKNLAESIGARRFNIPESVWNKMSEAERWGANQKFLDRMISRGDDVILSTPLDKVRPGSYFAKELEYLGGKGYRPSADGSRLIRRD